jgi:putative membrane protein
VNKESEDSTMMWGYGYDPGWSGWLMMVFGNLLWIALLGILVWAVICWFERRASRQASQAPGMSIGGPSAMEILRQRYACGEIDATTFEQMRKRLQASDASRALYENRPMTGVR